MRPTQRASSVSVGVAQNLAVGTHDERQFVGCDAELLDQHLAAGIRFWIEPLMRMTVAGEEVLQPQHVAVVGPADDDRAAGAGFQQAHAAQDQRAHDALAELGLGNRAGRATAPGE